MDFGAFPRRYQMTVSVILYILFNVSWLDTHVFSSTIRIVHMNEEHELYCFVASGK